MTASPSIGSIVLPATVERRVIGRYRHQNDLDQVSPSEPGFGLKGWMAYYQARIDDEHGQIAEQPLQAIQSWWTARDARTGIIATNRLPAIVVMTAGDTPTRDRDGELNAVYRVLVSARAAADSAEHARELAGRYIAAARASLLRHPTLGGFARRAEPGPGEYDLFPARGEGSDYRASAVAEFAIHVRPVLTVRPTVAAPTVPPADPSVPPEPLPDPAEEANLTVTATEETP